jgi:alpha 1,3-glucosidase
MPLNNTHFKEDGSLVRHRDVHNAYGALQHRSTFRGLLERDNNTRRPFVLTRSHFFGSQRYGAMWTGDNNSLFRDVP